MSERSETLTPGRPDGRLRMQFLQVGRLHLMLRVSGSSEERDWDRAVFFILELELVIARLKPSLRRDIYLLPASQPANCMDRLDDSSELKLPSFYPEPEHWIIRNWFMRFCNKLRQSRSLSFLPLLFWRQRERVRTTQQLLLPLPSLSFIQNTNLTSTSIAVFLLVVAIQLATLVDGMGLCFGGYPACCQGGKNTCGPFCASCSR